MTIDEHKREVALHMEVAKLRDTLIADHEGDVSEALKEACKLTMLWMNKAKIEEQHVLINNTAR